MAFVNQMTGPNVELHGYRLLQLTGFYKPDDNGRPIGYDGTEVTYFPQVSADNLNKDRSWITAESHYFMQIQKYFYYCSKEL